jgi:hypothetical protein
MKTQSIRPLILTILLHFLFSAAATHASGVDIPYTMPRGAMVSLNVTRPDGWVVRELIVAQRETAGKHTVHWDGRDNLGYLLPAGARCGC